jgi:septal ring factor EnvC (AmiA/AmiB activator)
VARKGRFVPPVSEIVEQYRAARRRLAWIEEDLSRVKADYQKFAEFHESNERENAAELEKRTAWGRDFERELEERTQWALALEAQSNELTGEVERLRSELAAIHGKWWWKLVGRTF